MRTCRQHDLLLDLGGVCLTIAADISDTSGRKIFPSIGSSKFDLGGLSASKKDEVLILMVGFVESLDPSIVKLNLIDG